MAVIAGIAARDMCWMLACCDDAVMAAVTGTDNLRVVNRENRCEDIGIVAILANIAGLDVCQILANGINTIMAVNTLAGNVQMVEVGWQPTHR